MIFKNIFLTVSLTFFSFILDAKIKVVTTTTDLKAIVDEVGGDKVQVTSFCKGSQDPHFLEAKPSYMIKTYRADLLVAIGLGLEVGWLPKVLEGSKNPKVMQGAKGYLEVGSKLKVLEVPKGPISRADGDVHPEGNPHVNLDPIRVGEMAVIIAKRLSSLEPKFESFFQKNAKALESRLAKKTKEWQKRIDKLTVKKLVTHHKTLSYFFDRFGIESIAMLEPLPGVPPTANHILKVIKSAKQKGVKKIFVENYHSDLVAKKVASDVGGVTVASVPVAVLGTEKIKKSDDLFEELVSQLEAK